jgi:hypothetical protein
MADITSKLILSKSLALIEKTKRRVSQIARIISEDLDTRRNAAFPAADPIRGA